MREYLTSLQVNLNNDAITIDEADVCAHFETHTTEWNQGRNYTFESTSSHCLGFVERFWPGMVSDRYIQYVHNKTRTWDTAAIEIAKTIKNKTWNVKHKDPPAVLIGASYTTLTEEFVWDDDWEINNSNTDDIPDPDGSGDPINATSRNLTILDLVKDRQANRFQTIGKLYVTPPWDLPATTVNAYYAPLTNTVFIPLGIMQPPLYHPTYTPDLNYGGLGYIIGHEIGHAHDYMGVEFDSNGRWEERWDGTGLDEEEAFRNWYKNATVEFLNTSAHIPQYSAINTLNEDIADYYGMKSVLMVAPKSKTLYYQFAQTWCGMRHNFTSDTHAPGAWRVNMSLRNETGFRDTFNCDIPTH
jgi:hypothetical protein